MTTTLDIREYLVSNSSWVDPNNTVDTIKVGDPNREITKAGVCWFASIETIKAAHEAGCQLLVTHEPTFWDHRPPEEHFRSQEPAITKDKFLKETGMVILRAHDTWDQWPEYGIRDSWAAFLGLGELKRTGSNPRWHGLYEIHPQTLRHFAQEIANHVAYLGEDSVQVIGDPDRIVQYPSVGVGCGGPDAEMVQLGSDVCIVCYDGAPYWMVRERLHELGAAVITVEHGSSEMPGLENLRNVLAKQFPGIEFQYFAEHVRTWTVMGEEPVG